MDESPDLTVFTLTDETYLPGAVGLIASLRYYGFEGLICIGALGASTEAVSGDNLRTVPLEVSDGALPANHKAELINSHSTGRFFFLDADIIDQHINYREGGQVRRLEDLFYGAAAMTINSTPWLSAGCIHSKTTWSTGRVTTIACSELACSERRYFLGRSLSGPKKSRSGRRSF